MIQILVQTGFGYYQDMQGHIITKAELPQGPHDLADGLVYFELDSKAELDAVEVYQDLVDSQALLNEQKIRAKIRQTAIDDLKAAGQLPPDFIDKVL